MRVLIEDQRYGLLLLNSIFDDSQFYEIDGNTAIVRSVGYYRSLAKNQIVYLLPKVFMADEDTTIFDGITPQELAEREIIETYKHGSHHSWIRKTLFYFYESLVEYRKRNRDASIVDKGTWSEISTNLGITEYSYLDLLLNFAAFYQKNKNIVLFQHVERISHHSRKTKWDKTIRKTIPLFSPAGEPVYTELLNRRKVKNEEEDLLTYFFSILAHFDNEHGLNLKIDKSYNVITGSSFYRLQKTGLAKLRGIKHRYYSDTMKAIYRLCDLYFRYTNSARAKKQHAEYLTVRNYNIVFEDMVDKLISDTFDPLQTVNHLSIAGLKQNRDGKVIDHIFEYPSIIDGSHIFYIGDSKYYRATHEAGPLSIYKQFTYAKNVIQYNIDLLNSGRNYFPVVRYLDPKTDGYNITPNFFIYGYIMDHTDFSQSNLSLLHGDPHRNVKISYHFEDRVFDRDTLFVHQFKINFLFVLRSYSGATPASLKRFRNSAREHIKTEVTAFFRNPEICRFQFFLKTFDNQERLDNFITLNFETLKGKVYCPLTPPLSLIIGKFSEDQSLNDLINGLPVLEL